MQQKIEVFYMNHVVEIRHKSVFAINYLYTPYILIHTGYTITLKSNNTLVLFQLTKKSHLITHDYI